MREVALVDVADADARVLVPGVDQPLHHPLGGRGDVEFVSEQVLDLGVARGLDPCRVGRQMVPHHHHRRLAEALDQQPRFIPDRDRDRAHRLGHALPAEPLLGRGDQGGRGIAVKRLEHSPLAESGFHMFLDEVVDLGADPANDLAVAGCEEQGRAAVPEPRIFLGVQQAVNFVLQGRDPRRIVLVDRPREIDEALAVGLGLNRRNGDIAHGAMG